MSFIRTVPVYFNALAAFAALVAAAAWPGHAHAAVTLDVAGIRIGMTVKEQGF